MKIPEGFSNEFPTPDGIHDPDDEVTGQETHKQFVEAADDPRCRTMSENASIGLCIVDAGGCFREWNHRLPEMLGYGDEELAALTLLEVTHPEDRGPFMIRLQELLGGTIKSYCMEKRYVRKDGSVIWAEDQGKAIGGDSDGPISFVVSINDVTCWKERELELRSDLRRAEQASAGAESAGRAKSEFLSSMKHELRTPLNIIIGYSQLLQDQWAGGLNDTQMRYLREISEAARHLSQVVNEIIDFSKPDSDTMDLRASNVRVEPLLQQCLNLIGEKAVTRGVTIDLEVLPELSQSWVHANEVKLKQLILSLLSCAVDSAPPGGTIMIQAQSSDAELVVSLAHTGGQTGIRDQSLLFGVPPEESPAHQRDMGEGFVWVMCRRLLETHGGRIWLETRAERKTAVKFAIPLVEAGSGRMAT